jgi:hypothetical protein
MSVFTVISSLINLGFLITLTTFCINLNSDKSPIIVIVYGTAWLLINTIGTLIILKIKTKTGRQQVNITVIVLCA